MTNRVLNRRVHPGCGNRYHDQSGFALIITLSLLTFLVLILFAMTSMTRLETRMTGGTQQMNIAQENARLALDTAIAQLQQHAGLDTRVTARADIDPTNDENPYWTGVWEDSGMGGPTLLTWLVSGNEDSTNPFYFEPVHNLDRTMADPYSTPSFVPIVPPSSWPSGVDLEFVRLVGLGSTGDNIGTSPDGEDPLHPMSNTDEVPGGVVVPKIPIFSRSFPGLATSPSADHVVGHYAFWVGDQGVKASLALSERHLDAEVDASAYPSGSQTNDELRRRLRQMIPQRMWFEGDNPNFTILHDYPQFELQFERNSNLRDENEYLSDVLNYRQVRSAFPDRPDFAIDTTRSDRDELKDRYHDITHMTYGVLANSGAGGLKLDLSGGAGATGYQDYLDVPFSSVTALNPSLGTATVDLFAPDNLNSGSPALVIAPIVTELVTKYSIWQDQTSGEMQVQLQADVELWNPYTVDLEITDARPLVLRLTGLEEIQVDHSFAPGAPEEIDLAASDAHYIPLDATQLGGIGTTLLEAGEILHLSYDSGPLDAYDGGRGGGAPVGFTLTDPAGGTAAPQIEISSAAANIETEVWLLDNPIPTGHGAVDSAISALTVEPVGGVVPDSFDPFSVGPYPASDDTSKFGYNYRIKDPFDDPAWLTYYDPRTIGLENGGSIDAIERDSNPQSAFSASLDGVPQFLQSNTGSFPIMIFELPIQEQVNIGALQHLYYHNEPAYALGNFWGGSVNSAFDDYFLSTIPQSGKWAGDPIGAGVNAWTFPVPNTRIVPYRSIDPAGVEYPATSDLQNNPESAEHLLVQGAFNINSTSINAWRSVIAGMNIRNDLPAGDNFDPNPSASGDWTYAGGSSDVPLTSAVFRFPQTAHLLNASYLNRGGIQANLPQQAYMQGVRELSEEQVAALAYEIVYLLRHPPSGFQVPFLSLRDFVESGIIQIAIDNCDLGTLSPGNPIAPVNADINGSATPSPIPPYSPAFITQADLLTGLAPFMAARSDTFVVRAYGDSYNPATGETLARAYCEAIVQRVPATLDPSDDPVNPKGPFGRRFEVIYFRWMTPDEL